MLLSKTVLSPIALALPLVALGIDCLASEVPEITTDRPDQTESSLVLPPGYVQLETGWTHVDDDEHGEDFESDSVPETLLRYGMGNRLELRFAQSGRTWEETRHSDGSPTEDPG